MNTTLVPKQSGLSLNSLIGRALATVLFSAVCLALPIGPALADGLGASTPGVAVQYAPTRLEQAGYADELYTRIEAAADQVCRESAGIAAKLTPRGDRMIFIQRPEDFAARCMAESVQRAVADVGSPVLDAVHEQSRKGVVRIAAAR